MRYSNLLSDAVSQSGWTYTQIVDKCKEQGAKISRSYLSKLCTGATPPASDDLNKVLVIVLAAKADITYQTLSFAKYKEIIPKDIFEAIASGT